MKKSCSLVQLEVFDGRILHALLHLLLVLPILYVIKTRQTLYLSNQPLASFSFSLYYSYHLKLLPTKNSEDDDDANFEESSPLIETTVLQSDASLEKDAVSFSKALKVPVCLCLP